MLLCAVLVLPVLQFSSNVLAVLQPSVTVDSAGGSGCLLRRLCQFSISHPFEKVDRVLVFASESATSVRP